MYNLNLIKLQINEIVYISKVFKIKQLHILFQINKIIDNHMKIDMKSSLYYHNLFQNIQIYTQGKVI